MRPTSLSSTFLLILAREQMKSMMFFDLIDLFAERRLSDVQPFGSPSEIQLLGQDKDCLQVTYFDPGNHRQPPSHAAEIGNRLHLIKEPPRGGKQQNNLGMTDGKRIAPYANIVMLFPLNLFLS